MSITKNPIPLILLAAFIILLAILLAACETIELSDSEKSTLQADAKTLASDAATIAKDKISESK